MKRSWKSNFLPWLVLLVLPISMIAVGLKYQSSCDINAPLYLILMGVILFGIGTIPTILTINSDHIQNSVQDAVKYISNGNCRSKNVFFVGLSGIFLTAASFTFPITFFWGSVIVFGSYDKWTYNETLKGGINDRSLLDNTGLYEENRNGSILTEDTYQIHDDIRNIATFEERIFCPYTPFMFSFVLLLLKWILISVPFIFCSCLIVCFGYSAGQAFKGNQFHQEDPEQLVANNR